MKMLINFVKRLNGKKVEKNIKLAKALACFSYHSPAEIHSNINILEKTKKGIDICDNLTSRFMIGHCQELQTRINKTNK